MQTPSLGGLKTGAGRDFLSVLQAGQHSPGWASGLEPGGQAGQEEEEVEHSTLPPARQEQDLQACPAGLQVWPGLKVRPCWWHCWTCLEAARQVVRQVGVRAGEQEQEVQVSE